MGGPRKPKRSKQQQAALPHRLNDLATVTVVRHRGFDCTTINGNDGESVQLTPSELRELVDWVGQNGYGDESK